MVLDQVLKLALEGVPSTISAAQSGSIPFLSNNIYGALTLVSFFAAISCLLVAVHGIQLYRKTGTLGDFAVWKE